MSGPTESKNTPPRIWMQWKGTDACFDFWCECSADNGGTPGHADARFAYAIECARCGRRYDMPQWITLEPFSDRYEPVAATYED